MKNILFYSFLLVAVLFSCKKKEVHKVYPEYATAKINGVDWKAEASVIHSKNVFGDNVFIKAFSFYSPIDSNVIEINFFGNISGGKGVMYDNSKADFVFRKNIGSPYLYSTEYNFSEKYGRITITDYDEGYGIEGTFEFTAFKTDSTKVLVTSGFFSAKDE